MAIEDAVDVTITTATASLDRASFGVPMLAVYHTAYLDRVRTYTSLAAMVTDGHAITSRAYRMASALKMQNPSVRTWKVGRRALPAQQSLTLTVTDATEGNVLSLRINDQAVSYTIGATETTSSVASAMELLIEALTGVNSSASGAVITITPATTNALLNVSAVSAGLTYFDNTPDPGIATDLSAIESADPNFFGVLLDSQSKAEVVAAAAWVEARDVMMLYDTMDTGAALSSVSTDVATTLQGLARRHTGGIFTSTNYEYASAAWMCKRFVADPGSYDGTYKTLSGITVSTLTGAQESALRAKNLSFYTRIMGNNVTSDNAAADGFDWDVQRFVFWMKARMQERMFGILLVNPKFPLSDVSGNIIAAQMSAQLGEGVAAGGLLPSTTDFPHTVFVPRVVDISTQDKNDQVFPDCEAGAYLALGAHGIRINIRLSV